MNRHLTYYDGSVYILNILDKDMLVMRTEIKEETSAATDLTIAPTDIEAGSKLAINFTKTEE